MYALKEYFLSERGQLTLNKLAQFLVETAGGKQEDEGDFLALNLSKTGIFQAMLPYPHLG